MLVDLLLYVEPLKVSKTLHTRIAVIENLKYSDFYGTPENQVKDLESCNGELQVFSTWRLCI